MYGCNEHDGQTRFAISDHKQRSTEHVMAFPITHKNRFIDIVQCTCVQIRTAYPTTVVHGMETPNFVFFFC